MPVLNTHTPILSVGERRQAYDTPRSRTVKTRARSEVDRVKAIDPDQASTKSRELKRRTRQPSRLDAEKCSSSLPMLSYERTISKAHPSESLDDLWEATATPHHGSPAHRSYVGLTETATVDDAVSSKKRDNGSMKFSFRKVFGRGGVDVDSPKGKRSSAEPLHNGTANILRKVSTRGSLSGMSTREPSVENLDPYTITLSIDSWHLPDLTSSNNKSHSAEGPNIPTHRGNLASKVANHHSTTDSAHAMTYPSNTIGSRPLTPESPTTTNRSTGKEDNIRSRPNSASFGYGLQLVSQHQFHNPSECKTQSPEITPSLTSKTRSQYSTDSDGRNTLRPKSHAKRSSTLSNPIDPSIDYPRTAPRQALERASFVARLTELETRMSRVERYMASLRVADKTARPVSTPQQQQEPYLTPPSSQRSDAGATAETWLDPSSSTSSFGESDDEEVGEVPRRMRGICRGLQYDGRRLSVATADAAEEQPGGDEAGNEGEKCEGRGDVDGGSAEEADARSYILRRVRRERAARCSQSLEGEMGELRDALVALKGVAAGGGGVGLARRTAMAGRARGEAQGSGGDGEHRGVTEAGDEVAIRRLWIGGERSVGVGDGEGLGDGGIEVERDLFRG